MDVEQLGKNIVDNALRLELLVLNGIRVQQTETAAMQQGIEKSKAEAAAAAEKAEQARNDVAILRAEMKGLLQQKESLLIVAKSHLWKRAGAAPLNAMFANRRDTIQSQSEAAAQGVVSEGAARLNTSPYSALSIEGPVTDEPAVARSHERVRMM
eukprot:968556-Rhodomonas_salina.1